MSGVQSFRDLRTWKESHSLAVEIYRLTKTFPADEQFGIISQLRRAAISVPSNIAEGMGRASAVDLIRFLVNSRGSTQEIISQLLLAKDLGYGNIASIDCIVSRYDGLASGINAHIDRLKQYK